MLTSGRKALLLIPALLLSGCGFLLGDNPGTRQMYNPATAETVECEGDIERADAPKSERDRMNSCITEYANKGFLLLPKPITPSKPN